MLHNRKNTDNTYMHKNIQEYQVDGQINSQIIDWQ